MSYSYTEPSKSPCAWPGSEGIDSRIKARSSDKTRQKDRNHLLGIFKLDFNIIYCLPDHVSIAFRKLGQFFELS